MVGATSILVLIVSTIGYFFQFGKNECESRYNQVEIGMTEEEVEAILGESDGVFWNDGYHHYWKNEDGSTIIASFDGSRVCKKEWVPAERKTARNCLEEFLSAVKRQLPF